MSNNPKIKLEADLSSFDAELNKLSASIAQIGDQLKSSSGKAHFNFDGSQKELNVLLQQAEKLTKALDKGDKTSKQYVKNLKAAQEAMTGAAKVAAKMEAAGDAKTSKVSSYFRGYSGELEEEAHITSSANALRREQESAQQKRDEERQSRNTKWANRAAKFAGFVGGSMLGGGGGYSTFGAGLGSMLPGPFGAIGGAVGGAIGGLADRTMAPARDEARLYSELRRSLGSTTTDFSNLRDSVRSVISGFAVTDNEAANLAKSFAKTAGLTGDSAEEIARGVGTSAGMAQSYGMSPDQTADFFAKMRLTGNANNDKDNRRLALMIGESVSKGGTSAKMDEVLGAISNFAMKSSQQMLMSTNAGQFSSYLSSLTGSGYSGVNGDPNSAAALINQADDVVRSGGTMGEASNYHWLQARQEAFPGMSAYDNELMQGAGVSGDLAAQFAPGSAAYDRAKENGDLKTLAHYDQLHESILKSGKTNNFQVGMSHISQISKGDSTLENANFRGMFGGNSQQAALLMSRLRDDKGRGDFEKKLKGYGIDVNGLDVSQLSTYSELVGGGDEAFGRQFNKLKGKGNVPVNEIDAAGKMEGDAFKKAIFELTKKYDRDDGLDSQVTQIGISNKIQESTEKLVTIETDMKEYLLRLLNHFGAAGPILNEAVEGYKSGSPMSFNSAAGKKLRGSFADKHYLGEVDDAMKEMAMTGSVSEKKRIADEMMVKIKKNPASYPAESEQWLKNALGESSTVKKGAVLGVDQSMPTIGPNGGQLAPGASPFVEDNGSIKQKIIDEAKRQGVPPEIALGLSMKESGLGKSMVGPQIKNGMHKGDRAYGPFQYMKESSRGWDRFNVDENIKHGVSDLKKHYGKFGNWDAAIGAHHTGAGRPEYLRGDIPNLSDGMSTTGDYIDDVKSYADQFKDQIPKDQVASVSRGPRDDKRSLMEFTHNINLRDSKGNMMAEPLVFTHIGAPMAAGS